MPHDPNSTTTFEVHGPGGTSAKVMTRSMQILGSVALALVIGYAAAILWGQRIQLDTIMLVQREILRQSREIKCTLYLSEADRKSYPSVIAACKASGEGQ
jgi:hypothetical protein